MCPKSNPCHSHLLYTKTNILRYISIGVLPFNGDLTQVLLEAFIDTCLMQSVNYTSYPVIIIQTSSTIHTLVRHNSPRRKCRFEDNPTLILNQRPLRISTPRAQRRGLERVEGKWWNYNHVLEKSKKTNLKKRATLVARVRFKFCPSCLLWVG